MHFFLTRLEVDLGTGTKLVNLAIREMKRAAKELERQERDRNRRLKQLERERVREAKEELRLQKQFEKEQLRANKEKLKRDLENEKKDFETRVNERRNIRLESLNRM